MSFWACFVSKLYVQDKINEQVHHVNVNCLLNVFCVNVFCVNFFHHLLFHSTTSTHSRTLRLLFATWHVRWLSRISIATFVDEIYHLIELPFDLLNDDAMFVCLLDELILGFCFSDFDMRNRSISTRIDYHPCITSEPTNQVC